MQSHQSCEDNLQMHLRDKTQSKVSFRSGILWAGQFLQRSNDVSSMLFPAGAYLPSTPSCLGDTAGGSVGSKATIATKDVFKMMSLSNRRMNVLKSRIRSVERS